MENNYWDIAARQLEGKATAAEQEALRRWLEADPAHKEQFQAQQDLWRLTAPGPVPEVDTHMAWQKVSAGIQPEKKQQDTKVRPMFPMAFRVAASVALLFGLLWLSRYLFFPYYGMEVLSSGDSQVSVMLPDSSQVWLNRNSKLVYDPDFADTERLVQLEGEAFFEVRKNPQRPFIIQAEGTETKVLGTSFNLRAYPDEATVELVVATGKVAFSSSRKHPSEVILTPGYAAIQDRESTKITQYSHPGWNAWSWKTDKLTFDGQALQSVLQDLERHYGVALKLQNPAIANCRFTGSFEQAKLEGVLQVLAATLQLEYHQQGDQTYIISGQGCK